MNISSELYISFCNIWLDNQPHQTPLPYVQSVNCPLYYFTPYSFKT